MQQDSKPRLQSMARRRFLNWVAKGAGVAVVGSAGTLALLKVGGKVDPAGTAVPIRNPAFRVAASDRPDHFVLFCQTGTDDSKDFIAFDLNAAAWAIWSLCAPYTPTCPDSARNLGQIAETLAGRLESKEVAQFVSLMREKGVVYFADAESQVFWEYQSVR